LSQLTVSRQTQRHEKPRVTIPDVHELQCSGCKTEEVIVRDTWGDTRDALDVTVFRALSPCCWLTSSVIQSPTQFQLQKERVVWVVFFFFTFPALSNS